MPNRWGTKPKTYADMAANAQTFVDVCEECISEQGHSPELDMMLHRWTDERDMYLEMAADLAEQMAACAA